MVVNGDGGSGRKRKDAGRKYTEKSPEQKALIW